MNIKAKNKAFTLVELSIVIVIIGLLIGGVSAGISLVRQVKLRTVASDFQKYETSFQAFKLQYQQFPGDIDNASAFFGTACDPTPSNCNGNNNKYVDGLEWGRIWQHLNLAGILPNNSSGIVANPDSSFCPSGPLKSISARTNGSVYFVMAQQSAYFNHFATALGIGANGDPNNGSIWDGLSLSSSEAKSIDLKIDDGIANLGQVFGLDGQNTASGSCSAQFTSNGADYNLASTTKTCWMLKFLNL